MDSDSTDRKTDRKEVKVMKTNQTEEKAAF